jgi:DNA-binding transcriptional LysR family regulator
MPKCPYPPLLTTTSIRPNRWTAWSTAANTASRSVTSSCSGSAAPGNRALGFVAAGLGITTIPLLVAAALPSGVVAVPVDDPVWTGRSMLLARAGDLTGASAAVRAALIEVAGTIAGRER